jgi:hypothetical protein
MFYVAGESVKYQMKFHKLMTIVAILKMKWVDEVRNRNSWTKQVEEIECDMEPAEQVCPWRSDVASDALSLFRNDNLKYSSSRSLYLVLH